LLFFVTVYYVYVHMHSWLANLIYKSF